MEKFVNVINGQRRHESSHQFPVPPHEIILPMQIDHVGNSIWEPGVSIEVGDPPFVVMELVTHGSLEFSQSGKSYTVLPGQIFLVRKGHHIVYRTTQSQVHKRYIRIVGTILDSLLDGFSLSTCNILIPSRPIEFVAFIKRAIRLSVETPADFLTNSQLAYETLLWAANNRHDTLYPPVISDAISFMQENREQDIGLADVLAHVPLSKAQFHRLFKQATGSTPMAFLQRERLKYAAEIIATTDSGLKELARRLHFHDAAHFSRCFKSLMGYPPGLGRRTKNEEMWRNQI